ncbi:alpha/beta fold hydrolase [Eleftheria terrae]|uniref:alpha/beta fold hydrolase n=1 Tax=Eleftheria terrae TaxID=1597781 RepID=UPI00263A8064|nr:alpha/beta hydrolase [Eleftheria terrae]WKB56105.1 alpha/beta hydrolase [Eleftheria terrae]
MSDERRQAVLHRHATTVRGEGSRTLVFAHGFGCEQSVWRHVAPAFESGYRVVMFDLAGAGRSQLSAYGARHASLDGYVDDLLELCAALNLSGCTFVGHSVAAMMGLLAGIAAPQVFARQIWIAPSPCFADHPPDYRGGFSREQLEGLLALIERNHLAWPGFLAPTVMQNGDRPELADELRGNFCQLRPEVAREFARIVFLGDHRAFLHLLEQTTLVLQCSADPLAPASVGDFLESTLRRGRQVRLAATGHCPHLSHPEEVVRAIAAELDRCPVAECA